MLIINGDSDWQVNSAEANILYQGKPDATLKIVEGMNHVLKKIDGGDAENGQSHNNPSLPLHPELIGILVEFIKS